MSKNMAVPSGVPVRYIRIASFIQCGPNWWCMYGDIRYRKRYKIG